MSETLAHLELYERDDFKLALADAIVRLGGCTAHDLADHQQELDRDASLLAELREGEVAECGEPLVAALLHEVERQVASTDGRGQVLGRQPTRIQALDHFGPADASGSESIAAQRGHQSKLDHVVQRLEADPRPLGSLLARVVGCGHDLYSCSRA
jgi:hypothetical protein